MIAQENQVLCPGRQGQRIAVETRQQCQRFRQILPLFLVGESRGCVEDRSHFVGGDRLAETVGHGP